jgi:uroporphyrin-III C-methyltransferase
MSTTGNGGRVTLIGAGPGDPDLLTVRAVQRLADADLVLYDALSSPEMRTLAPEARWFYVGKRADRDSIAQDTINRILIREASRGRHVVRLKAGDPFVLGRGGEEAIACQEANIPCEVVPGLTSAVAAPTLFGIPVTHRGVSTAFVVASGHTPSAWQPLCEGIVPGTATLIFLMCKRSRGAIATFLMARGWPSETPAALLLGAATPRAHRWIGTLGTLADCHLPDPAPGRAAYGTLSEAPGIVVVGAVVDLAHALAFSGV